MACESHDGSPGREPPEHISLGSIHENTANGGANSGGGIYNGCGGINIGAVAGGNVYGNSPDDIDNAC